MTVGIQSVQAPAENIKAAWAWRYASKRVFSPLSNLDVNLAIILCYHQLKHAVDNHSSYVHGILH